MSIFGGDAQFDVEHDSSADKAGPVQPTLPPTLDDGDSDAKFSAPIDTPFDADDEQDSDHEYSDDDELEPDKAARPNKFLGKASTWRGYTAADRRVASALEQIESGDLAAHLYNAHALKRRVLLPAEELETKHNWHSKNRWRRRGDELESKDPWGEVQKELVPRPGWTAWPLPPEKVPKPGEWHGRKRDKEGEAWVIGALGEADAGEELREEILAALLRVAKNKWEARMMEEEALPKQGSRTHSGPTTRAGARSSSRGNRSTSEPVFGPSEDEGETTAASMRDYDSDQQRRGISHLIRVRGRPPLPAVEPIILADDDRARVLMQSTINAMLARLDALAIGLRKTRLNHFADNYSDTSGNEMTSDANTSRPVSRARSKSVSRAAPRARERARANGSNPRSKQAQSLQDVSEASASGWDTQQGVTSEYDTTQMLKPGHKDPSAQVGLLDWSEVLGIAAMTGWDQKAVARTAQRCAALFGEGMSFRSFYEASATKSVPPPVQYTPTMIHGPAEPEVERPKRPLFDRGSLRCPHVDCSGHQKEYEMSYRVIEHVKRVHGYDPRTNDSDNEERKEGGVHIDGFMQPITVKQGWLGRGRNKAEGDNQRGLKKRKTGNEE